ncbi:LGFP repeat-containing protein [Williamsia sp. CHRR-6]|uniref:LGFP repeat-containing protein n=1 Tax=Williamsia sp. CHRR-6 TaxID=2835871 RepID=UPI001BDB64BF|nr:lysozyme [Williamsia sp. CHRR-6]MBT0566654.1 lysozyme [Williamsia sp. CHRR-6]
MRTATKQRIAAILTAFCVGSVLVSGQIAGPASADSYPGGVLVKGRIEQAYLQSGGQAKWGRPLTTELVAGKGGRFQLFSRNTSFYWNPRVDFGRAHQISGPIRAKWGEFNWENGKLGYPVTNEFTEGNAKVNFFQGGTIYYSKATGAHPVWGGILFKWRARGGVNSTLGLPIGDEQGFGFYYSQKFQNGTLYWP